MKHYRFGVIIIALLLIGCAPSRIVKIEKSHTPFERPSYTVYSPQGEGWLFFEGDQIGEHVIIFGLPQKSKTHTLYAKVSETPSSANFDTPKEFQSFFKKIMIEVGFDPRRYKIVKEENKLESKFGDFSVLHYSLVEDHGAAQCSDDAPYLLMETFGYYFIHPHKKNKIVNIIYSERGKQGELDERFIEKATAFINDFNLKK